MRKFRITAVDMHGFNGRDLHPELRHNGMTGFVLKSHLESVHHTGETKDLGHLRALAAETMEDADSCFEVFVVYLPATGEVLELIEHEIEFLSGEDPMGDGAEPKVWP